MIRTFDIAELARAPACHFVVRADFAVKPGGDVDLANQLSREAHAAGAAVRVVPVKDLGPVGSDDLLFLFNIDRPADAVAALDRVPANTRAFLYTLHHPREGVARYLRSGLSGARGAIARMSGGDVRRYEALVDIAKGAAQFDGSRIVAAIGRDRVVRRLLDRCELLVVSPAELTQIEQTFGIPAHGAALLPHPVAAVAAPVGHLPFRYALIAGRIEPRKNQLAAIEALAAIGFKARGIETAVVGGAGSDAGYFHAVVDACLASGAFYVTHLPKQLFFPVVSSAAVVLNPSFFEVTSLIDLYAIQAEIPLVTTRYSYYPSTTGVEAIDPDAWTSNRPAIAAALDRLLV